MKPLLRSSLPLLVGCLALAGCSLPRTAPKSPDWTHWRGPSFNGSSPAVGAPETFSKTENVKWTAAMPGPSAATPAILGDRVFVSSTDQEAQAVLALCLDRRTGKELWRRTVAQGFRRDDRSNFASPSPTTDGQRVYFFYGTSDLVAFDLDGNEVWRRNIEKDHGQFAFLWTFSSSPLVHEGVLYLQVLQRDEPVQGRGVKDGPNDSYLLGLDPKTGKQLFKVARPTEARQESREAFSSPIPFTHNGRTEILVSGADMLSGHDPRTGEEYWRWGTWNPQRITHWRLVPSPVAAEGVVLGCGPKNAPIFALKLGQHGTLDDQAVAWSSTETRDITADVPTPAYHDGVFYVLNGTKKMLLAVDPKTGKELWSGRFESRSVFESSPTVADGRVYCMDHAGQVFVVQAGREGFKLLHTADFGDDADRALRSSIVLSNGEIFIRAGATLYCLGK